MSLPAPSYAIQVDPKWNNVFVDAIEVEAASGSPLVEQEVILWDSISEKDQQFVLDVVNNAGGWPVADLGAELDNAYSTVPSMTIPATFPRPAAPINNHLVYYDDATWKFVTNDGEAGNAEVPVLDSVARTATLNSEDFTNFDAKGGHIIINVTAITGTPSIVPVIQGKDPISGNYYDILEGNPITTTGINVIKVYPGISAIVNAAASDILPPTYRVRVTHADTDSITYSVASVLVG